MSEDGKNFNDERNNVNKKFSNKQSDLNMKKNEDDLKKQIAFKCLERFRCTNLLFQQTIVEFLGTFLLIFLIDLSLCTIHYNHSFLLINVAFVGGVGLYLGFIMCSAVGVGHLNPAVTISLASVRKVAWIKVPIFIIAQLSAAFSASLCVYIQFNSYFRTKEILMQPLENDTIQRSYKEGSLSYEIVQFFHSIPDGDNSTLMFEFLQEFFSVGILMFGILLLLDNARTYNTKYTTPFGFLVLLAAIILAFGGAALNPSRELAGRLFTTFCGLGEVSFSPLGYNYWWIVGLVGPIFGGLIGTWTYYLLVEIHGYEKKRFTTISSQTTPE